MGWCKYVCEGLRWLIGAGRAGWGEKGKVRTGEGRGGEERGNGRGRVFGMEGVVIGTEGDWKEMIAKEMIGEEGARTSCSVLTT